MDEDGRQLARATSSVMLVPAERVAIWLAAGGPLQHWLAPPRAHPVPRSRTVSATGGTFPTFLPCVFGSCLLYVRLLDCIN